MKIRLFLKLLFPLFILAGCTSLPPIEDTVTDFDFKNGLYQVKVVQKDSATIHNVWKAKADALCPEGYSSFDMFSDDVEGGGYIEGGPGLVGYAINEGIKERGQMLLGYILCNSSELTVKEAKSILWGTGEKS